MIGGSGEDIKTPVGGGGGGRGTTFPPCRVRTPGHTLPWQSSGT